MIFRKVVEISDSQMGFLFKNKQFQRVLGPGKHSFLGWVKSVDVRVFDLSTPYVESNDVRILFNEYESKLLDHLVPYQVPSNQVGVLYESGNIKEIITTGRQIYIWRKLKDVEIKMHDIERTYDVPREVAVGFREKANVTNSSQSVMAFDVEEGKVGLLYVDGQLEKLLNSGKHYFWKVNRTLLPKVVDLRLQTMEVNGQEILTKDRVSLRINLTASYRVTDPQKAVSKLKDFEEFVYKELQLKLREVVGTRSLDELLADKHEMNENILKELPTKLHTFGIELSSLGIKDIVLPGEMKQILNRVVEAQKESEANLIRRKEETQAMRSLHNTAKMMENNPIIMRLKELESLEKITEKVDRITVSGGLEGILKNLLPSQA